MPAQTEKNDTRRSYFLDLERCQQGEMRPLNDVIEKLAYNNKGLIPAVVQDAQTGKVLMLAWMNRTAIEKTLETERMTYFSRSRNELWIKGQTSGHCQQLVEASIDCDGDALLFRVIQEGSACHTARNSCFYLKANPAEQQVYVSGQAHN